MIRVYICKNPSHKEIANCGEVLDYNPNAKKRQLAKPPVCSVCKKYMTLLTLEPE